MSAPLRAEAQGLMGTVSDSVGRPIAGAEVTVIQDALTTRTGAEGRFVFPSLRAGGYMVRVRAIGYAYHEQRVTVPPVGRADVRIVLQSFRPMLDSVRASVSVHQCPTASLMGFACRRDAGSKGHFRNVEDVERLNPEHLYDLFAGLPGIRKVVSRTPGEPIRLLPGVRPSRCLRFLVNGRPPRQLIQVSQILAVEYYDGYNKIPMGYRTFVETPGREGCDLIVYWMRNAALIGRE
jgi:hypothetical protein